MEGKHLGRGNMIAVEEVGAEGEEEEAQKLDLGKEK